MIRYQ